MRFQGNTQKSITDFIRCYLCILLFNFTIVSDFGSLDIFYSAKCVFLNLVANLNNTISWKYSKKICTLLISIKDRFRRVIILHCFVDGRKTCSTPFGKMYILRNYSYFFISFPLVVKRYCWVGLLGESGCVISINPISIAGCK